MTWVPLQQKWLSGYEFWLLFRIFTASVVSASVVHHEMFQDKRLQVTRGLLKKDKTAFRESTWCSWCADSCMHHSRVVLLPEVRPEIWQWYIPSAGSWSVESCTCGTCAKWQCRDVANSTVQWHIRFSDHKFLIVQALDQLDGGELWIVTFVVKRFYQTPESNQLVQLTHIALVRLSRRQHCTNALQV